MSSDFPDESRLLKEAADWAIALRYETPDEPQRQAFSQWLALSPAHAAAWAKAQAVFATFAQVPDGLARDTVQKLGRRNGSNSSNSRRGSMRLLGALLLAAPVSWLAWRRLPIDAWSADVSTATGERKTITLPDGTELVLNTASAVNIAFNASERRIHLVAGEILITTHADPSPTYRPFLVDTPRGLVRALGTRFIVRKLDGEAYRVAVLESAVEIRPLAGASRILRAGEQADFGVDGIGMSKPVDKTAALWEQGMLLAKDMRLGEVIAELARYRSGVLRCSPAVADLRVSGAISLMDTDAALLALANSLPLRIDRHTRYWVTVNARS